MRKIFYTLFIVLGWMTAVQAQEQTSKSLDKIAAIVGKNIILQSDIDGQYMQFLAQGNKASADARCQLLQQLLTQKLLKQQADIDSITVNDAEVEQSVSQRMRGMMRQANGDEKKIEDFLGKSILQYEEEMKPSVKEMMIADRMHNKIVEKVTITPDEVAAYYKSIPKDSLQKYNTEVEVGNIEMYPKLTREEKQVYRDKIEALRLRVKSGESFATLAKLYSEDPGSAQEGGEYYSTDGFAKEYTSWAFKLKKGEISPVFETDFGYHFIQVLDRKGDQIRTRHILIIPKPTSESLLRLQAKADSLYNKLIAKKYTFATAASEYSDNLETKFTGGMMMTVTGDMSSASTYIPTDQLDPSVFLSVDTMKVGNISKPKSFTDKQGKQGVQIFYLKNRVGPHVSNLDQDYPKIQRDALNHKMEQVAAEWFDKKRTQTYLKISPEYQDCSVLKEWIKLDKSKEQ